MRRDYGALERAKSPILASDLRSLGGIVGVVAVRDRADEPPVVREPDED